MEERFGRFLEFLAPFVAEFLGTYLICMAVAADARDVQWGHVARASAVMVSTYAVATVSGANLNPAVSLSLWISGRLSFQSMLGYISAQVSAGISAVTVLRAFNQPLEELGSRVPFSLTHVVLVEMLFTTCLVFVFLNCVWGARRSPDVDHNQFFGLAIGSVIVAGGYISVKISGAMFNPACVIGLCMYGNWLWGLLYISVHVLSSLLACALFYGVRQTQPRPITESDDETAVLLPGRTERQTRSFTRASKLLSEAVGVVVIAFTARLGSATDCHVTPLAVGAAVMSMTYSLGDVSAHFNPAVTLAVVVSGRGKCSRVEGGLFALVQFLVAACVGIVGRVIEHQIKVHRNPIERFVFLEIAVGETLSTLMVVLAVLSVTTVTTSWGQKDGLSFYSGLTVGACFAAGGFSLWGLSAGELNPVLSLATLAAEGSGPRSAVDFVTQVFFQVLGGLLAASAFALANPKEYKRKRFYA